MHKISESRAEDEESLKEVGIALCAVDQMLESSHAPERSAVDKVRSIRSHCEGMFCIFFSNEFALV